MVLKTAPDRFVNVIFRENASLAKSAYRPSSFAGLFTFLCGDGRAGDGRTAYMATPLARRHRGGTAAAAMLRRRPRRRHRCKTVPLQWWRGMHITITHLEQNVRAPDIHHHKLDHRVLGPAARWFIPPINGKQVPSLQVNGTVRLKSPWRLQH